MTQESLKRALKFVYLNQWRIWFGLIILIFTLSIALRSVPGIFNSITSVDTPNLSTQTLELFGAEHQAPLRPADNLTLSEPLKPLPLVPSPVPVPELPAISSSQPVLDQDESEGTSAARPTSTSTNDIYVVQAGDSLWKLSEAWFGDGYQYLQIARANDLAINAWLQVGQELRRPAVASVGTEAWSTTTVVSGSNSSLPTLSDSPSTLPYTVQEGDSLWSIAAARLDSGHRWTEIYDLNQQRLGNNPSLIYPRSTILLPEK